MVLFKQSSLDTNLLVNDPDFNHILAQTAEQPLLIRWLMEIHEDKNHSNLLCIIQIQESRQPYKLIIFQLDKVIFVRQ